MSATERQDRPPTIRRATAMDAPAIAELLLSSFRAALPAVRLVHGDDEVRTWVRDALVAVHETWLAEQRSGTGEWPEIVGFMTLHGSHIEQLYVAVGHWRQGIGSALLDIARARSPRLLELYTFQVNAPAISFYLARGFTIVDANDGSRNEEQEPDYLMRWSPGESATA